MFAMAVSVTLNFVARLLTTNNLKKARIGGRKESEKCCFRGEGRGGEGRKEEGRGRWINI